MSLISYKQLIDLAIGSPESGTVNFYALHCVLCSFADKLNCLEEKVDCSKYGNISKITKRGVPVNKMSFRIPGYEKRASKSVFGRLKAGADAEEEPVEGEATEVAPVEEAPVEEAPEETLAEVPAEPEPAIAEPESPLEPEPEPATQQVSAPPSPAKASPQMSPKKLTPQTSQRTTIEGDREDLLKITSLSKQASELVREEPSATGQLLKVQKGLSLMTRELDLAMSQLQAMSSVIMMDKPENEKAQRLRKFSKKLRLVQKYNAYLRTMFDGDEEELELFSEDISEETLEMEEIEVEIEATIKSPVCPSLEISCVASEEHLELESHLIYTPAKMTDQLIVLKGQFCKMVGKVDELNTRVCEFDYEHLIFRLDRLDKLVERVENKHSLLQDQIHRLERKYKLSLEAIEQLNVLVRELDQRKAELSFVVEELLLKANVTELQRRPTYDELAEVKCSLDKDICKLEKSLKTHQDNVIKLMQDLRDEIGPDVVNAILQKFRDALEAQIKVIADALEKYIKMTNDDCAAAGARVQVLNDLACISCDTECVMRVREKSKVAMLPNAHPSAMLGPVIAYELGTVRKSGISGYYRKEDFKHKPNDWMKRQQASIKKCVPRHSGGPHTTHTAKDLFDKVMKKE